MIEILLTNLTKTDFYEETLRTIEKICDDYGISLQFGTLSMANQMVCDYLESLPQFDVDVAIQVENDHVAFHYTMQNGDFGQFSQNKEENTGLFVLNTLADEISFTSDLETLTTTFHVKTKMKIQREIQHQEVRKNVFHTR